MPLSTAMGTKLSKRAGDVRGGTFTPLTGWFQLLMDLDGLQCFEMLGQMFRYLANAATTRNVDPLFRTSHFTIWRIACSRLPTIPGPPLPTKLRQSDFCTPSCNPAPTTKHLVIQRLKHWMQAFPASNSHYRRQNVTWRSEMEK